MAEERTKKYAIEFKLYDGTTRSVSIEIPLGEDGGYYIPSIENKNGETLIYFTPSSPDMPAMEPIPVLNLNEVIDMALTQAKESGKFDGKDGETGPAGPQGPEGPRGEKGEPGANGKDGQDGQPGKDGQDGRNGLDGKTPVKGEDYWTDADKQEVIDDVLGQIDIPDVSVELPVFDLAALGMSAVTLPAGVSSVSTDTTELQSALSKGDVIFVIPVNMGGTTIPVHAIMQGIALGTSYQCMTLFVLDGASALVINVEPGSVTVMVMPAATAVGFPEVTTEDNGKFLQVVDGSWAAVALQDVSEVGA